MNMTDVDYIFKILIIGDSSVGKSNLLLRFSDNIFHDTFLPTIGVDFKIRNVTVGDKSIKLNIWDTAGQERFKTITAAYYKGAHGIILVFDITDRDTFNNINSWIGEIRKHAGPNVVRLLVGNKCDLDSDRKVTQKEAKEFAESQGMTYIETSAKARINVDEAFMTLTKQVYEALPDNEKKQETGSSNLRAERKQPSGGCCN
jgi:Ras-related protein Rab-1A